MVTTMTYRSKEYTPAPSAHFSSPEHRLRIPAPKGKSSKLKISDRDLDFLTDFIKVSAYYVDDLEDHLGEELFDFWEARENALRIITDLILQKAKKEEFASQ